MYQDKNKTFACLGNEHADKILCMLENNSVLSEDFTSKIRNIVLTILSNMKGNEEWVYEKILELRKEMQWLNIFSESFIFMLNAELLLAAQIQEKLNEAT